MDVVRVWALARASDVSASPESSMTCADHLIWVAAYRRPVILNGTRSECFCYLTMIAFRATGNPIYKSPSRGNPNLAET